MTTLWTRILTLLLTLLVGGALAAWWVHFRPLEIPRLARVDIGSLVGRQQQTLVERIKPGMAADEQGKLFEEARVFGLRLEAALDQVSQECQCALINSAALLKTGPTAAIPDLSARVAQLVIPVVSGPPAK